MDQGFPHFVYDKNSHHRKWGLAHGEEFSSSIKELASLRRDLMVKKSPHLRGLLNEYALAQLNVTKKFHQGLFDELNAISEASGASLTDLTILNNYTDFRDISLRDEGCTTMALHLERSHYSAQTWDMHSSAKDYLCTLELPDGTLLLSLVGCLGMMGVNPHQQFIGVNNLNTKNAVNGLIWPALIRSLLEKESLKDIENELMSAPVTSGHNYLLSDGHVSKHIEVSPTLKEVASTLKDPGVIYHTNHCLTSEGKKEQDQISVNSTTFDRYQHCEKKASDLKSKDELYDFLTSHEGYPKSICSHYQSGALDPSTTCGGALYDFSKKEFSAWRGCPHEDQNFIKKKFKRGV